MRPWLYAVRSIASSTGGVVMTLHIPVQRVSLTSATGAAWEARGTR